MMGKVITTTTFPNTPPESDRVVWRRELREMCNVTNETIRRWIKSNRLPPPDVALSYKTMGWRMSTLRASGINLT